jgi:DNA-binding transcriptional regulator GbsR (MarR family)
VNLMTVPAPRIPRAYYARRLLEHGPLDATEFREITRWPAATVANTLRQLADSGQAEKRRIAGTRRYEYRLA